MSEVRVLVRQQPHELFLRVLTCFVDNDSTLLVCIAGDKAEWSRNRSTNWYDAHVPIADAIVKHYLSTQPKR